MRLRNDLPVELVQHVGSDAGIAAAARVSTGTDAEGFTPESLNRAADHGLIDFLMRNRHGSPFEHGSMTFRVEAPIFVAREFMRHRIGWSYNEASGRYRELDMDFYAPEPGRPLVQVGKPGAYEFVPAEWTVGNRARKSMVAAYGQAATAYQDMLEDGVAKEVARMVLPVGIYTQFYATCNPRSLMHFLSLRTKDDEAKFPSYPMHEIEQVARQMEEHFRALYPSTATCFDANGRVAP